jgi:hypothetical protein
MMKMKSAQSLRNRRHEVLIYLSTSSDEVFFRNTIIELVKRNIDLCVMLGPNVSNSIFKSDFYTQYLKFPLNFIQYSREFMLFPVKTQLLITSSTGMHLSRKFIHFDKSFYLPHSAISLHMGYDKSVFDYFDYIFSVSKQQDFEFSIISRKQISNALQTGYAKFDVFRQASFHTELPLLPTVLIGLTWGSTSVDILFWDTVLKAFEQNGFQTVFRVHELELEDKKSEFARLIQNFNGSGSVSFESSKVEISSGFTKNGVMVGDYSGLSFEYASMLRRPVIFLNRARKVLNKSYAEIPIIPAEIRYREDMGQIIEPNDPSLLIKKVEASLSSKDRLDTSFSPSGFFHNFDDTISVVISDFIGEFLGQ